MKKLFLTSAALTTKLLRDEFFKLVGKSVAEIKVVFVPTASRTKEELHWVGESKKELFEIGIQKENVKVIELNHHINYSEIKDFDVLYVCGGNTFYLMHKTKETGFDKAIKQFVQDGKVYLGVSAGSMIIGPNIEIAGLCKDWDKNDIGLKDFTGLNLTDIEICPHFQDYPDKERFEKFKKTVDYKLIGLTDEQALLVTDDEKRVIG